MELTITKAEHMTKEQEEAYDEFIDCMVKIYREYGNLADKEQENAEIGGESV